MHFYGKGGRVFSNREGEDTPRSCVLCTLVVTTGDGGLLWVSFPRNLNFFERYEKLKIINPTLSMKHLVKRPLFHKYSNEGSCPGTPFPSSIRLITTWVPSGIRTSGP